MREAGMAAEQRVAVCIPKSLEAVVLIHAVFAAGAAYVPLEFQSPVERLAAVLDAVRPHLLITTPAMARQLRAHCPGEFPPAAVFDAKPDGSGLEALIGATPPASELPGTAREPGRHRLHLGLHRRAQGRDAVPAQLR